MMDSIKSSYEAPQELVTEEGYIRRAEVQNVLDTIETYIFGRNNKGGHSDDKVKINVHPENIQVLLGKKQHWLNYLLKRAEELGDSDDPEVKGNITVIQEQIARLEGLLK